MKKYLFLLFGLYFFILSGCYDAQYNQNKESTIECPSKQNNAKIILNDQNNNMCLYDIIIKVFNFYNKMNERKRTGELDCNWGFGDDRCYSNWLKRIEQQLTEMSNRYNIIKIDTTYGSLGEPVTYSVWYR